jgi:quercetin dioxygenase-like cupin family protein|tara:strand:- start:765 stop:1037 length:273 start_codon:yes stop_codon:yes gene_type:complete
MKFPFKEKQIGKQLFLREFSTNVDEMDLIWHTDREDRIVHVLEGNKWKFQFDEQLPFEMLDGIDIIIPKGIIHRIIKGNGPLKIKVYKEY